MKTLGEALDRARSTAEELCTRLGASITNLPQPPGDPNLPATSAWPTPTPPPTRP